MANLENPRKTEETVGKMRKRRKRFEKKHDMEERQSFEQTRNI